MSEHICRNCRWWAGSTTIDLNPDWAGCDRADSWNEKRYPYTKAVASDAELYHAVLHTAPDFGCVQWEGKE